MPEFVPLPFEEAIKFFRDKIILKPGEYQSLIDELKARAFSVSGIAKMDILEDIFTEIERGLSEGITFNDFKKSFPEIMQKHGWAGLAPYRLDTIFRTNIQSAYQAGHYLQLMEVADRRPYWQYVAVLDSRTRPSHAAMNGKVFRFDHPFWKKNYPPNGFNCRCTVRALSERELEREGLKVSQKGQDIFDSGWGYNVGEVALKPFAINPADPEASYESLATLLSGVKKTPIEDLPAKKLTKDMLLSPHQKSGMSEEDYINAFLKEFNAEMGKPVVYQDVIGDPMVISEDFLKKDREIYLPMLADTIKDPVEIWLAKVKDKDKIRLCKRYIGIYKDDKGKIGGYAVLEIIGNVWRGTTVYKVGKQFGYLDRQRTELLLYAKK